MRNTLIFTFLLTFSLCITSSFAQTLGTTVGSSVTLTINGTITTPAGYDLTIEVEAYGAGGGTERAINRRHGGGGGAYFIGTYSVSGCNSFPITVGQGARGSAGGSTSFNFGGNVVVGGGGVGTENNRGAGGTVTGGTAGKPGGRKETSPADGLGGGGGGGGSGPGNTSGSNGVGGVGGAGGNGTGVGGKGGDSTKLGKNGGIPGGGAGGKGGTAAAANGRAGGRGQVKVTVKSVTPMTAPTTACYETATINNSTCAWVVTGTQPAEPTTACYETATFNTGSCAWVVTGTQPAEPTTACYETATFNNGSCSWNVTGTQDAEPTTACYETATFNNGSCAWVVTGTQPAEPTTACYETATFNNGSCSWNVTGTQDAEPTTACYETATFNNGSCAWVVTGTQPAEPTTACYETATFNNGSCAWVVTGNQPAEPTTACYETATFNNGSCSWNVTGTQDAEPTTACYETATFNTGSCAWVVTGTQPAEPTTACYETATFNNGSCSWNVTGTQDAEPTTACYETATFNNGSCAWVVTGTQPAEPTTACYETATFNNGSCAWVVTGTQPAEPTTACYETATFNNGSCSWNVTGTQDAEPTTACYETATFNTGSCAWVVTGTQPAEPTTACYETATFNNSSCSWNVTGTQDAEPTTTCYETATFNNGSCAWVVTGTQPAEPTTACYETATFNNSSCSWNVTGTQDAEPTTACYETATFNNGSCAWVVTGTQPAEPTTACYETATFNTGSCAWVVTGTQPAEPTTACYETATFNNSSCSWNVTGTQDAEPTTTCYETATFNTGSCAWVVTGTQPAEPTTACYETATFNNSSCSWNVTGTQDAEPTTACYETATFNNGSCAWVVTGTQPAEPTTACYETATFNNGSCSWNVTGTQDAEPTTACYETATFNNGSCSWDVTGTQPAEPTTACYETATFNSGTCMWALTGTQPAEPTTECYETATFNNGSCSWDVTGTQPAEPTTACYETATFNSGTCMWAVTGTQPAEPTTECYETATFNNGSCSWDVTGTQPAEPTTACYETATFNSGTCMWALTGTQPAEPTTACYETATFNNDTCMWAVTGTQPAEPTTECYETATFNNGTCMWAVTGTQPAEPTTACYETATFNNGTCMWAVTGTQPAEPSNVNCWDDFQFNTTTCTWFNAGAQQNEPPKVNCWDDFQFNTTTCAWFNAGTQQNEPPKVNCWDDFQFNTTTCAWFNAGAQQNKPPNVNCWDNFQFNTTTCVWDNDDQPNKPTNVNCWDDFQFNTTTCVWANAGSQDNKPSNVNCWDDFQFNQTTCAWFNAGSQPDEPTFTLTDTYCEGEMTDALPLSSDNAISGTWSPTTINNTTSGSYIFTPDGAQCPNTFTLNVTITPNETPTFSLTDTYCEGEMTDALPSSSDNGITGSWSPTTINNTTSGNYIFTPDGGQCATPFTLNVTITPNATPTFTLTDTYCIGDMAAVLPTTSDNGITGTWSPTTINTSAATTSNFTFTPDGSGCSNNFSIQIAVNDCGCANPAMVNIDPINPICENETINLNALLGGSATMVTWTTNGDGSFDNAMFLSPVYSPGTGDVTAGGTILTATTDDPDGTGVCLAATQTMNLVINSLVTPIFTLTDTYCEGETTDALPSISDNGITGSWDATQINNTTSGSYIFTPDGGQCATPFTLNVTIAPNETPIFTLTDTYCIGDMAAVLPTTSDNGITGTWSPTTINTSAASTSTFTFTPDGSGCSNNFSIQIAVNDCGCANPAMVNIDPINPICENETINLNALLGGSATMVTWTTNGDGSFDNAMFLSPVYSPGTGDVTAGGTILTATTDDPDGTGVCLAATQTMNLVINSLVTPIFTLTDTYCEGETTDALPSISDNGITGSWDATQINNTTSGSYIFTPDGGQCATPFTLNVTIAPNETPIFTLMDTYCIGDMAAVLPTTSDNGITGTWSPTTINTSAASTSNFTFTPDGSGCSNNFTIQIAVNDCGCANPAMVSIDPINPICENETINLNALLGGSATMVTWTTNGDGSFDNAMFLSPVYSPGTGDMTAGGTILTATTDAPDGTGVCLAATQIMNLVINSLVTPTFTLTDTYCEGETTDTLPSISDNGITGSWDATQINNTTSGNYIFTPDAAQCANPFTLNVTITPNEIPTFSLTDTYCIGDMAAVLPTTSDNGITGTWSPTTINTSAATTGNFTFTPDGSGCSNNFTIQIAVNDCGCANPAMVSIDPINPICENETINLNALLGGSATMVTWTTNGDGSFDNAMFLSPVYSPGTGDMTAGGTILTATTDDPDGTGVCLAATQIMNLVINSLVTPTFTLTDTYCEGETTDALPSISDNGITGSWDATQINNTTSGNYIFTPDAAQCANPFTLNVTITPNEIPTFSLTDTYCIGDMAAVLPTTSDNGITGTWSPTTINTSAATTSTFTFTPDGSGCSNNFSIQITVNDCGCANPATVSIDPINPICENETINLNALLGGSATMVTWTTNGDGSFDNAMFLNPVYSPGTGDVTAGGTILTATTDDPDGTGVCLAATQTMNLVINPLVTPIFTLTDTYCIGDMEAVLPTTSDNGITGTWSPTTINTSAATTGNFTFTPDGSGCSNNFTIQIAVNDCGCANPATVSIDPINPICENETINLNALLGGSATMVTWTTNGDGSFDDVMALNPVYSPGTGDVTAGGTILTATTDDPDGTGVCLAATQTMNLVINPLVTPIFTLTNTYCEGETTDALPSSSDNGITGTWDATQIDNTTSGSYIFTPDGGQCATPFTFNVTIAPNVTPTFSLTDTYCIGDMAAVLPTTSANGITGTWSPTTINTSAASTSTFTFTPDGSGCSNNFSIQITVNDCGCANPATVNIDPINPICENETINLNALLGGSATMVTWTTNGDGSFDNITSLNPVYSPGVGDLAAGGTILTATTDDSDGTEVCIAAIQTINLVINSLSTPTFTLTDTYCEGETTVNLPSSSDNGITGTWNATQIDNSTSGTYIFTPDAAQCANPFTLNVTITPNATPTFTLTDTYCEGDMTDALPSSSDNGITGTWDATQIDNTTSGTYIFTPDGAQCENPFTLNVTINPLPNMALNSAPDCSVDMLSYSVDINLSNGDMVISPQGVLTDNGGGNYTISDIPANLNITLQLENSVTNCTNIFDITAPNCDCEPIATPTGFTESVLCSGGLPTVISVDDPGVGFEINWFNQPFGGTPLLTGLSFTPLAVGIYYAETTEISSNCVSDRLMIEVIENSVGSPTAELTTTSIGCDNPNSGSILVNNVVGGLEPYLYSIDNRNTFTVTNNFNNLAAGEYEIIVQDINGCESLTTAVVNDAIPVEVDLELNTTINFGQSLNLNANVNIPLSKLDTIIWTPSDSLSCLNCLTPTATPSHSITYQVLVVDTLGCEGEASISIIVDRTLRVYAPNAFSPNGDGHNDRFTIFSNESVKEIEELKVFDRWRNLIYFGKELPPNDLSRGWDGTDRGEFLNPATFLFFAKLKMEDGRTEIIQGEVSLTR